MFSKKDTTRKLGTWPDPVTADIAAGTLKASGIDCEVRNTLLWSAAGELPPDICAPEIWLTDARDMARARAILKALMLRLCRKRPQFREVKKEFHRAFRRIKPGA